MSSTCKRNNPDSDDKFSLTKRTYIGNELRTDGFYCHIGQNMNGHLYSYYFFYKNGIIRYGGGSNDSLFYANVGWVSASYKNNWGIFNINGNQIKFEKWEPSSGGPFPAYLRTGEILNDTTFKITQLQRSDGTNVSTVNDVYHFKKFSPKPDSTNNFIQ